MEYPIRNIAVFDSIPLELRPKGCLDAVELASALLDPNAPGDAWVLDGDEWVGANHGAVSRVESPYSAYQQILESGDPDAAREEVLNELDLVLFAEDTRLRHVLDGLDATLPSGSGGGLDHPSTWPGRRFWIRVRLQFSPHHRAGLVRIMLRFSIWASPPAAVVPPEARSRTELLGAPEAIDAIREFEDFAGDVAMLGLFFGSANLGVRSVFGSKWLQPTSVLIEPDCLERIGPDDYLRGKLAPITGLVVEAFLIKSDFRDPMISASELERASLCLHRQFSAVSSSGAAQLFSKYCHLQLTPDVERFEDRVEYLVAGFEAIESEVSADLWDISTDLEMARAQFNVQRVMASDGGSLVDALVVRLLESGKETNIPRWRLRCRHRLQEARLSLRETIELVRRTLLQTEGERDSALSMVDQSEESIEETRSYVNDRVSRLITQVPVEGHSTVSGSLLASEQFRQASQSTADSRRVSTQGAQLGHLLETTTNVFGEERARALAAVERNGSLLNIALGIVALFAVVQFAFQAQITLTGAPAVVVRSIAITLGIAVLGLLAWLWLRNRRIQQPVARSALPDLQHRAITTMRRLRAHTDVATRDSEVGVAVEVDEDFSLRVCGLIDELEELKSVALELRKQYLVRGFGAVDAGYAGSAGSRMARAHSRILDDYLSGRESGRDFSAAADIELLRIEASLWAVEAVLYGERPGRMYNARLPLTTAIYYLHPAGSIVSAFEVSTQMRDDEFGVVRELGASVRLGDEMCSIREELIERLRAQEATPAARPEEPVPQELDMVR